MSVSHQVWGKSELRTHPKRSLSHIPMGSHSPQPTGTGGRQKCSQLSTQPPFWRGEASLEKGCCWEIREKSFPETPNQCQRLKDGQHLDLLWKCQGML